MAKQSFSKAQNAALSDGFFDLLGQDSQSFEEVKLDNVANSVIALGAKYANLIIEKLNQKDVASSGDLADSVQPTELEFDGVKYVVKVQAKDYISFVDAGVNGWAVNRGSVYSFKTKGVDPNGKMVKSLKEYLKREGASARNIKVGISKRENKGISADDRNAITAAYMIKRQGIEPKRFLIDATKEMEVIIESEFGKAFKIDLINNLTK
jgi:hypothetical protein